MKHVNKLDVFIEDAHIGTLARSAHGYVAFEYSLEWIERGYSINPLSLPLKKKVFIPSIEPFEGIFGVFADSMPDGWGRLLVDRYLRKMGINEDEVDSLYRLMMVSDGGMGALSYKPSYNIESMDGHHDYDKIAGECKKMLEENYIGDLDKLFAMGGSSGGARPKILSNIDGEDWIIKFPSSVDNVNIGKQEYDYSLCAKACQIEMSETRLFLSKKCDGYFGTKRFDRKIMRGEKKRIHMVSAGGILETSHRIPNLDYNTLMKLTMILTKDLEEVEKLFRLMCFNVFAHNRDDHSKNFSFLYDEERGGWKLSPAYDLTYSSSVMGEHATTVNGKGKNPSMEDILEVAKAAGLDMVYSRRTAAEIEEIVKDMLKDYLNMM